MLEKLKEFKELITVLVFFTGGFIFIETRYAALDDFDGVSTSLKNITSDMATRKQLKTVNCLLNEYMTLTQLQIRAKDLDKQIESHLEILKDRRIVLNTENLSPGLKTTLEDDIDELNKIIIVKKTDLHKVESSTLIVGQNLQRHTCGLI